MKKESRDNVIGTMKKGMGLIAVWSLLVFLLSLHLVSDSRVANDWHAYPYLAFLAMSFLICLVGLVIPKIGRWMFWFGSIVLGSSILPYCYAQSQWPGYDDGAGMGWLILVGPAGIASVAISIFLIATIRNEIKNENDTLSQNSNENSVSGEQE